MRACLAVRGAGLDGLLRERARLVSRASRLKADGEAVKDPESVVAVLAAGALSAHRW